MISKSSNNDRHPKITSATDTVFTGLSAIADFPSPGPINAPRCFFCGRARGYAGNHSWCNKCGGNFAYMCETSFAVLDK